MSLTRIVLKNVAERKLSSALTTLSIALGVAVVIAILGIKRQSRDGFNQSAFGYELIVGPKGSALQLVLNTVYHLDTSPGNVPYEVYKSLRSDRRVRAAYPIAVGDHYRGFRIVAATDRFLTDFEIQPGRKFVIEGRPYVYSEERLEKAMSGHHVHGPFEAVIGAIVARKTGLRAGSTFEASHGEASTHEEKWTVVGILRETGTPADRAIFINLESFFAIREHESRGEISAVIVKTKGFHAMQDLQYEMNRRPDVMAVAPAAVVGDLFEMIGKVDVLLLAVSVLVIVVAGISILVSIFNSMSERRRAIAIMRALGARRTTVLAIILLESVFLCIAGGVIGLALGHGLAAAAASALRSEVGLSVSAWAFHWEDLVVLGGLLVLGAAVGTVPAAKAYRTDVAEGLQAS